MHALAVGVGEHDLCAGFGERERRMSANAFGGSRNNRNFTLHRIPLPELGVVRIGSRFFVSTPVLQYSSSSRPMDWNDGVMERWVF